MPNAHWQENRYKNVIKDDGKNGDETSREMYLLYWIFYLSRNNCHLYQRIENMLQTIYIKSRYQ